MSKHRHLERGRVVGTFPERLDRGHLQNVDVEVSRGGAALTPTRGEGEVERGRVSGEGGRFHRWSFRLGEQVQDRVVDDRLAMRGHLLGEMVVDWDI